MMIRGRLAVIILATLALAVAIYLSLFRHTTHDNPALGIVTIEYRWGKPEFILVDANRDGKPDARARIRLLDGKLSPHDIPVEIWESTQCNGISDLHALFDSSGNLSLIEFDTDQDGQYDKKLVGVDAATFLRELPRPPNCGKKIDS